jgi:two-component system, NtrC family, sensor kinase
VTPPEGTILVVDDRPASRYPIVHALKRAGFSVLEASTGREALEFASGQPAVVVLDVKLPDILGYEVCRRIKANRNTSHILVLQLSAAFLSDESKVHALESRADAFLTPPVEPNVLVATVRSLVRLHDAEVRNRRLGEQWQTTFDALGEGVALVDAAGIIQRCNRALTDIFNRSYSEIEGRSVSDLLQEIFSIDASLRDRAPAQEAQVGTRYFRFNLTPILPSEVEAGSIFIVSEITEQKRAQAALVINERLAATGRIANTIAHEINNPLEAMTNLLYLMARCLHTPEVASDYLAEAQEQLSRVSRIARQILSFNREAAFPVSVHLFELLDDVLALNNRAIVAKALVIEKEWNESVVVRGFPAQLRQVFSNLLRNAIEASYSGKKIRLRISGCSGETDGSFARVSFADYGAGIPKDNIGRVFEAFFTTKELRGSGIGLWLSNTIVQEHHGRIQVKSSACPSRSGTCVSVLLPCDVASAVNS